MKIQTFTPVGSDLALRWDPEHKHFDARGRARDFVHAAATMGTDTPTLEPWDVPASNKRQAEQFRINCGMDNGKADWKEWMNGDGKIVAKNFDAILPLANKGWGDAVQRVASLAGQVRQSVPAAMDIRPRSKWREEGDDFDIHRCYSGNFESMFWGRSEGLAPGPRIIHLVTPIGGHCGLGASELFWCGAAALVCTDVLQAAGYRVGIVAYNFSQHSNGFTCCGTSDVKAPGQHLQLAAVATALCLPAFFRMAAMRFKGHAPMPIGGGWGSPGYAHNSATVRKHLERNGTITPSSLLLGEIRNRKQCITEIKRCLAAVEAMRPISRRTTA